MKKIFDNPNLIIILLTIFAFILIVSSCSKEEFTTYWPYIQQSGTIDIDESGEFYHNHHIKYDYRYSCYMMKIHITITFGVVLELVLI